MTPCTHPKPAIERLTTGGYFLDILWCSLCGALWRNGAWAIPSNHVSHFNGSITPEVICAAVCQAFGVSHADLVGNLHFVRVTWPRHVAMFLIREMTKYGVRETGALFGRDHSSVSTACRCVREAIETYPEAAKEVAAIKEGVGGVK